MASPAQNPYSLYGIALARFHEAFGQSTHSGEHEHQWSLKSSPFAADIHVLLTGWENKPVIWIFDTNDSGDGASRSVIEHEESIFRIISHLRARVRKASRIARQVKDRADYSDSPDLPESSDSDDSSNSSDASSSEP
jgi:hypothetical protein